MNPSTGGQRTGVRCQEAFSSLGYDLDRPGAKPRMRCSSWSPGRRRRCGNVGIARLGFWRDFQARGEAWKSLAVQVHSAAGHWPDFFHAFHGASFPQRCSPTPSSSGHLEGAPRRRRFVFLVRGRAANLFSQEVKLEG